MPDLDDLRWLAWMTLERVNMLVRTARLVALTIALHIVCGVSYLRAEEAKPHLCTEDAMIVFDASGSMYGDGWGYASTSRMSRIDNPKSAIANVLPTITRSRRVGGKADIPNAFSNVRF